jgi:hypothetical protein
MLLAVIAIQAEGRSFFPFQVCHSAIPPGLFSGAAGASDESSTYMK